MGRSEAKPHRATREEREMLELRTRLDCLERRCQVQLQQLTDLQDRHRRLAGSVRLLEGEVIRDQPKPPTLATDQELYELYDQSGPTILDSFRAIYDLGRQHGAAQPAPATEESSAPRAAIREVAAWLRARENRGSAAELREDANR